MKHDITLQQDQFESPLSLRGRRNSVKVDHSPVTPKRPRMLSSFSITMRRANSIVPSGELLQNSSQQLTLDLSPVHIPTTLAEVLETMSPLEVQFVDAMDKELDKVQDFYRERQKDALVRSALIKEQLNELKDHRKIFCVRILSTF
jgi:hypothetical protein